MVAARRPGRPWRVLAVVSLLLASTWVERVAASDCVQYDNWSAELGSMARDTRVSQVAVVRPFAYVSNFDGEVEVIDLRDPGAPQQVGVLPYAGRCAGVCAQGSLIYLAFDDSLAVIDATDGGAPRVLSTTSLGSRKIGLLHSEGRHLWAEGADSLHLYDLDDPVHPRYRSSIDGYLSRWPPAATDTLAFAVSSGRIQIYSVANMDEPLRLGRLPQWAADGPMAYRNGILYTEVFGFDIRDPLHPVRVGEHEWRGLYSSMDATMDLQIFGDTMFVSTFSEIVAVDVSDPLRPEALGVREAPWGELALDGGLGVHVTHERLTAFDRGAFQPVPPIMTVTTGDTPQAAVTVGNLVYMAADWGSDLGVPGGLRIFEARPSGLRTIGKLEVEATPSTYPALEDVLVLGSMAYVVHTGDVWGIDVADPTAPRHVSTIVTPGQTARLASNGQLVACMNRQGDADVYRLLPDGSWDSLTTWSFPGGNKSLLLSGSRAFVGGRNGGVLIASVLDPVLPRIVAQISGSSATTDLALAGNTLFVLESNGVLRAIEDVDSPTPVERGRLEDPDMASGSMVATGSTVWIGGIGSDRLAVVDVSDLSNMRVVSRVLAYDPVSALAITPAGIFCGLASRVLWGGGSVTLFPFRCGESEPDLVGPLRTRFVGSSVELSWATLRGSLSEFAVLRKQADDLTPTWTTLEPVAPDALDGEWTCQDRTANPSTSYLYILSGKREDGVWLDFGSIAVTTSPFEPFSLSIDPNPVQVGGRILYRLPESGIVTLDLVDVAGRRVERLRNDWHRAGEHELRWPGTEVRRRLPAAGVYWIRLETPNDHLARRILLIR